MTNIPVDALRDVVRGTIRVDTSLSKFSTFRIGGPASVVVTPLDEEDVAAIIRFCRTEAIAIALLGLGSNLLIGDEGFEGVVMRMAKPLAYANPLPNKQWRVGAGLPIPHLARRTAAAGLSGLHRLVGVPGTVGGGVFMNAGAHGQEFADRVVRVRVINRAGSVEDLPASAVNWSYRSSGLDSLVLETVVQLEPEDPVVLKDDIRRYLGHRRAGTPFDQACCGSVFRNPSPEEVAALNRQDAVTAGRLIEEVGMKGFTIGGAQVSPMHANYIVNLGGATAANVNAVITEIQRRVLETCGVRLVREVKPLTPWGGPA